MIEGLTNKQEEYFTRMCKSRRSNLFWRSTKMKPDGSQFSHILPAQELYPTLNKLVEVGLLFVVDKIEDALIYKEWYLTERGKEYAVLYRL